MPTALQIRAQAQLQLLRLRSQQTGRPVDATGLPLDWAGWLRHLFPRYVAHPFADRHAEFWEWVWAIELGIKPARPFIGIWPRGGGKSTSAELATVCVGVRGKRKYGLYVRETQDNADKSVGNIAGLLESDMIARHYPDHARRSVDKYGSSKGWRRNRLRTDGGFTVDAIGLDTAARGVKVDEFRPDFIIFDDVDGKHDSEHATKKKIETLTHSLLPAGSSDAATIGVQNLIIPNGVFSRLADGRADFLVNRIVSGPFPAVEGLKTAQEVDPDTGARRNLIVAGVATWGGQSLEVCQEQINDWGLTAFKQEAQHDVREREGALWTRDLLNATRHNGPLPRFKRVVVGVDPSGGGDEIGIIVAGLSYDNHGYIVADDSQPGRLGPLNWGRKVRLAYHDAGADLIAAEKNFGGDMVESNIRVSSDEEGERNRGKRIPVKMVSASRGKDVRAEPIATLFEDGVAHMVGSFPELEGELTGWVPGDPNSPNRLDAMVWAMTELMVKAPPPRAQQIGSTSVWTG